MVNKVVISTMRLALRILLWPLGIVGYGLILAAFGLLIGMALVFSPLVEFAVYSNKPSFSWVTGFCDWPRVTLRTIYSRYLCPWLALRTLKGCHSILELGCGHKSMLYAAGIHKKVAVTGIDIFQPYVDEMSQYYADCVCADITKIEIHAVYDAVVCMDVIEHLNKVDGISLIGKMMRWGKKIIITTPNGFQPNPVIDRNHNQKHLSGWTIEDFTARGFKVRGLSGWKVLRTTGAKLRFESPYYFWALVSLLTIPICYWLPRYAWHLLATYERRDEGDCNVTLE